MIKKTLLILCLALVLIPASKSTQASEPSQLKIELILAAQTGEYHAPYVAAWLENENNKAVRTLLLWRTDPKWLKDIRRWWRKIGRKDSTLVDAVTSATHGVGKYPLTFNAEDDDLSPLANGKYTLYIEVVREKGGRAIVKQAFNLNGKSASYQIKPSPETGEIKLTITPPQKATYE